MAIEPRLWHKSAARILPRFLTQINGIAAALEGVDFSGSRIDQNQVSDLDAGIRVILAVRKTLKECSQ